MSDKGFLEKSFPSLRTGVIPVEKYGDLEEYCLPPSVEIAVKNEPSSINAAMETILDDLPSDDPDAQIIVGFDSEWNIEVRVGGRVHERGHTSIIQISYKNRVYILQVSFHFILILLAIYLEYRLEKWLLQELFRNSSKCCLVIHKS